MLDAAACAELIDGLTAIIVQAARAILRVDADSVRRKADGSPVTAADETSETVIGQGLSRLAPSLPIVSEEQAHHPAAGKGGDSYFLVDPLDGTREFIAGSDEYVVNIAVVSRGAPLVGVIAAPALGLIWRGIAGRGAERLSFDTDGRCSPPVAIHTRATPPRDLVIVVSRSHLEPRTLGYVERFPQASRHACGSALKFCRVAEGAVDLYPRLAPTHDWDVGAGHALVVAAGGRVVTPDGASLRYGTADLLIPGFIAWGGGAH